MEREDIKAGDEVALVTERVAEWDLIKVARCERVTKAQVILTDGNRYHKKTGFRVGEPRRTRFSFSAQLMPYTDALRAEVADRQRFDEVNRAVQVLTGGRAGMKTDVFRTLPADDVTAIIEISERFEQANGGE